MNTSPLRPVGQLLRDSFILYKEGFKTYLKFLGVILLSIALMGVVGLVGALLGIAFSVSSFLPLALIIIAVIVGIIVGLATYLGFLYAIDDHFISPISFYLHRAFRRELAYVWTGFLSLIIIFIGFILLVIPGIMWVVSYSLFSFTVLFEEMSGMAALRRSKEYIKGHWWGVFGRLVLLQIIINVANLLQLPMIIQLIWGLIGIFVLTPISSIYTYLMYKDLKAAKSVPVPPQEQMAQPVTQ